MLNMEIDMYVRRVASFDVGLKNMSLCLVDFKKTMIAEAFFCGKNIVKACCKST